MLTHTQIDPKDWQPYQSYAERQRQALASLPLHEVAALIAQRLQETDTEYIFRLYLIVRTIGVESSVALLQETFDLERQGGVMVLDGSRRRTPGGLYIHLAKLHYRAQLPPRFWPRNNIPDVYPPVVLPTLPGGQPKIPLAVVAAPVAKMQWDERIDVIAEIRKHERGLANVKIALTGRPTHVQDRGSCVVFGMTSDKLPALPAGLPLPQNATKTLYVVYVAMKQWKKVATVLNNPDEKLLIEGVSQIDVQTESISVYASSAKVIQPKPKEGKV